MSTRLECPFRVTGWEATPYGEAPALSRVKVTKVFTGDLEGECHGELLMCMADPADYLKGAGYVVSDRFVGKFRGQDASFVFQHWGVSGGGAPPTTAGHIVPGCGTGALVGLTGTVAITIDAARAHTLILEYDLP
jgi:uncharacterized protein DUF3224